MCPRNRDAVGNVPAFSVQRRPPLGFEILPTALLFHAADCRPRGPEVIPVGLFRSDGYACHRGLASRFVPPCIPTHAPKPSSGPDWVHEIKHDGGRLRRRGDTVQPFTRGGWDLSGRYPAITVTAMQLRVPARAARPNSSAKIEVDPAHAFIRDLTCPYDWRSLFEQCAIKWTSMGDFPSGAFLWGAGLLALIVLAIGPALDGAGLANAATVPALMAVWAGAVFLIDRWVMRQR
jgi:hypothetical protein